MIIHIDYEMKWIIYMKMKT